MVGSERGRRLLAATIFVGLTSLAVASSALAAGWRPPVDVSAPQTGVGCGFFCFQPGAAGVDVAVSSSGDTVVAWTRRDAANNQVVQARYRPAGGSFGPVQDLGITQGGYFLGILGPATDVAIDDAGRAIVVWPGIVGGNTVVQAATRGPSGSFGPAFNLSDASQDATDPHVAISRSGHTIAVWTLTSATPDTVQYTARTPGGSFSAPTGLSVGADATGARAAINDAGAATVVWAHGSPAIVQARVRPGPGELFGAVQNLSSGPDPAASPDVAIDRQGRSTVIWSRGPNPGDIRIQSRALTAAGLPASGVDDVSEVGRDGNSPQVALDSANTAVAAWIDCPTTTSDCVVATAARPSGASFGAVQPVSAPGDNNSFPKVVVDSNRTAVIAWSQLGSPPRVQTIRRSSNGSFGGVESISSSTGSGLLPAVAVDGAGSTVAAWAFTRGAPDNRQVAQFGVFDAGAPELRNLSVANGRALQALRFSVTPFDRFSPVSVTWTFGDGASAAGPSVQHVYGGPGTFTATVTATDAAGNASTASATIQVGAADRDGDGFAVGQDCDDGNAAIHPGAVEVRGNSIDENCDGRTPGLRVIRVGLGHTFAAFAKGTRFRRFVVKKVPKGSTVRATCKVGKRKCRGKARKTFRKRRASGKVNLKRRYVGVFLRKRTKITVRVTKPGFIGAVKIVRIRARKAPKITDRCLPPEVRRPQRC